MSAAWYAWIAWVRYQSLRMIVTAMLAVFAYRIIRYLYCMVPL